MLFYALKKGFGGYESQLQVDSPSVSKAKQKLIEQGYTGKWLLVPIKNIVTLNPNQTQNI